MKNATNGICLCVHPALWKDFLTAEEPSMVIDIIWSIIVFVFREQDGAGSNSTPCVTL